MSFWQLLKKLTQCKAGIQTLNGFFSIIKKRREKYSILEKTFIFKKDSNLLTHITSLKIYDNYDFS